MEQLFDSLSEEWISQPRDDESSPASPSPSFARSTSSQQSRTSQSRIPRAVGGNPSSPLTNISFQRRQRKSTGTSTRSNQPLKEVTAAHINASIGKSGLRQPSNSKEQPKPVKAKADRKPTITPSVQGTVSRRPETVVTPKSQRKYGTPDWKKRLRKDIAMGKSQDLFSPIGLEGVFRPLSETGTTGKGNQTSPRQIQSLQSSPPPYPPISIAGPAQAERLPLPTLPQRKIDSTLQEISGITKATSQESLLQVAPSSQIGRIESDRSTSPVSRLDHINERDDSTVVDSVFSHHQLNGECSRSFPDNRKSSGRTDDKNENISPFFVSRHNTVGGQVGYAAVDLSISQLRKRMDRIRLDQQLYRLSSSRDSAQGLHIDSLQDQSEIAPHSDWQNQSLPDDLSTGTAAFTLNSGFVTTRRGGHSTEGSFMRRSLSPSSEQVSNTTGLRRSLSAGAIDKFSVSTPSLLSDDSTKDKEPRGAARSPLRLFDKHDTFTNDRLLRRLGPFHDNHVSQENTNAKSQNSRRMNSAKGIVPLQKSYFGGDKFSAHEFDSSSLSFNQSATNRHPEHIQNSGRTTHVKPSAGETSVAIFRKGDDIELTMQGKRPLHSSLQVPRSKRRRTLEGLHNAVSVAPSISDANSVASMVLSSPSVLGKKRKDALHGRKSEAAGPEILAQRQILRPRTLTHTQSCPQIESSNGQSRCSSHDGDALEATHDDNNFLAGRLTDIAVCMVDHVVSSGFRKPSVTTADFHKEAQEVMQLLRMQGRPLARLSEDATEEKATYSDENTSTLDHESTKENFSRPPSREGSKPRQKEGPKISKRVISQLQKYKENDEPGLVFSASLESLKLAKDSERHRGDSDGAYAPPLVDTQENEMRGHESMHSRTSSDPSTQRSIPTNSSKSSCGKAVIPPEAVAHLLTTDVAGMTFDQINQRWVRCKYPKRPSQVEWSPHPGSILTEEDVFAKISDLSTEDLDSGRELIDRQDHERGESDISRHDYAIKRDDHTGQGSRPHTADGVRSETVEFSSAPSKIWHYASSGPVPETRATSWGDEGLTGKICRLNLDAAQQNEAGSSDEDPGEDVEHEISILDGREQTPSRSQRRKQQQPRVVTVTFSSPLEGNSDFDEPDGIPYEGSSFSRRNDLSRDFSNRRRRVSLLQKRPSSMRKYNDGRAGSLDNRIPRPLSRLDEQDEVDGTGNPVHTGGHDLQVAISTPLAKHQTPANQITLNGQASSVGLQLTPLSAFTVHAHDKSLNIEGDYLARRVGRDVCRQGSLATQDLVRKLQDAQPDEPYWEYLPSLALRNQSLSTLHMLNIFCASLVQLDVSNNTLVEVNGVPPSVRHLKASDNMMSDLTPWTHLPNLQYLNVSGNQLTNLQGFRNLVHLRELRAENNRIESLEGIEMLDGLIRLDLSGNKIKTIDLYGYELWVPGLRALAQTGLIHCRHKLEYVRLNHNEIIATQNLDQAPLLRELSLGNYTHNSGR